MCNHVDILSRLEKQETKVVRDDCVYSIQVEPIELTIEIWQKNGFCDKYGVIPEDNDLLLEISIDRNGFCWTIGWNEYKIIRLRYVHELQHAIKLCGINKTIEL